MGKATINSHLGGGLYNVTYTRDVSKAQKRLSAIAEQKKSIEKTIYYPGGLFDQKVQAETDLYQSSLAVNAAVSAWIDCEKDAQCQDKDSLKSAVRERYRERGAAAAKFAGLQQNINALKAMELQLTREISFLQSRATDREFENMDVYCADASDHLTDPIPPSTVVGTVELYGATGLLRGPLEVPAPAIVIQPHYTSAAYDAARDGKAEPVACESVATALFNVLEFPMVACHSARYMMGRVLSKDSPTQVTVQLEGDVPGPGNAPSGFVGQTLSSIHVEYMQCQAAAFQVDDLVVVDMTATPKKVIGFANGPRPCPPLNGWKIANGVYIHEAYAGANDGWVWYDITPNGGNLSWRGKDGKAVSWVGPTGKHVGYAQSSNYAFHNNIAYNFGARVKGACSRTINSVQYIYALVDLDGARPNNNISMRRIQVGQTAVTTLWTVAMYTSETDFAVDNQYAAFFSPLGDQAVFVGEDINDYGWKPIYLVEVATDTGVSAVRDLRSWGTYYRKDVDCTLMPNCRNDGEPIATGTVTRYTERVLYAEFASDGRVLYAKAKLNDVTTSVANQCFLGANNFVGTYNRVHTLTVDVEGVVAATCVNDTLYNWDTNSLSTQTVQTTRNSQRLLYLDLQNPTATLTLDIDETFPAAYSGQSYTISRSAALRKGADVLFTASGSYSASVGTVLDPFDINCDTPVAPTTGVGGFGSSPGLDMLFPRYRGTPNTETTKWVVPTSFQMAFSPEGKYIMWHGALSSNGALNNPNDGTALGVFFNVAASGCSFHSDDVSQTLFESQSGRSLPYSILGVV